MLSSSVFWQLRYIFQCKIYLISFSFLKWVYLVWNVQWVVVLSNKGFSSNLSVVGQTFWPREWLLGGRDVQKTKVVACSMSTAGNGAPTPVMARDLHRAPSHWGCDCIGPSLNGALSEKFTFKSPKTVTHSFVYSALSACWPLPPALFSWHFC